MNTVAGERGESSAPLAAIFVFMDPGLRRDDALDA
jgi:hypothetical protein